MRPKTSLRDISTIDSQGGGTAGSPAEASADAASQLLADSRDLALALTARAAECEAASRMPLDVVDTLR